VDAKGGRYRRENEEPESVSGKAFFRGVGGEEGEGYSTKVTNPSSHESSYKKINFSTPESRSRNSRRGGDVKCKRRASESFRGLRRGTHQRPFWLAGRKVRGNRGEKEKKEDWLYHEKKKDAL